MSNYDEPPAAVIFDIDGTLANVDHRRHFVTGKRKDFTAFYEAMVGDTIMPVTHGLCNSYFMQRWHVTICTGRPEAYREVTELWLAAHGVWYHELIMRPDDRRYDPDFEVKQTMLDAILEQRKVHVVFDDRDQVVEMWRRNGITCFQVAPGTF